MPTEFGKLLTAHVKEKGMTLLGFAKLVGKSQGNLSNIIKGEGYAPPLDQIDRWADALELRGRERETFLESAQLEHCPEAIRKEFLRQRMYIEKLEARIAQTERR